MRRAAPHPDIVLGFEDEVWWSRAARPATHAWSEDEALRLVEMAVPADDPDGKAIACYGLYGPTLNPMQVRFVQGRPVSCELVDPITQSDC